MGNDYEYLGCSSRQLLTTVVIDKVCLVGIWLSCLHDNVVINTLSLRYRVPANLDVTKQRVLTKSARRELTTI